MGWREDEGLEEDDGLVWDAEGRQYVYKDQYRIRDEPDIDSAPGEWPMAT